MAPDPVNSTRRGTLIVIGTAAALVLVIAAIWWFAMPDAGMDGCGGM